MPKGMHLKLYAPIGVDTVNFEMEFSSTGMASNPLSMSSQDNHLAPPNNSMESCRVESKEAKTNAAKANEYITSSEKKENDHNENKASTDQDLFIYASHLDIYEQPKDKSEKETLLEKSNLLEHFGVTAMEQVINEEYQMHWRGLRIDIESIVKNYRK
ncbi:hypothetical protein [Parasitella parasitica]|uniref:Uncharacterized protein n=1 Tax=Parasitella parasitica TaxID=35722 RepID=A0A0B7N421_9FUNG|nr:hypothetical protein [Parasitella parasitica]